MGNWKEYRLGDIVEINKRSLGKDFNYKTIEYIDTSSVTENKLESPQIISLLKAPSRAKRLIQENDTIISTVRPIQKHYAFIKKSKPNTIVSTGFAVITPKNIDPKFLYYFLTQEEITVFLNTIAESGSTTFPAFKPEEIANLTILAPESKIEQEKIGEILSSLDNKIELNNQINRNIEALAQALFKQWFIDFEFPDKNKLPYKSSGGEMVESKLGEIPKGWKIYYMDDLLETVSKTYPLKKVEEVIFLNTGDIQEGKVLHNNKSATSTLPGQAKKSIKKKDILYSEIRPINKRYAYVYFDADKYVVSTKLMVLRSKVEIDSMFQYFVLTQKDKILYLQQLAESRSGTFPQITFSELSTIMIVLPKFELVNEFVKLILRPYFDLKFQVEEENKNLINLRDSLLPQLISGELNVSDVQILEPV